MGLYDLLAPQFLLGFQFPAHIDDYLSKLAVSDLQMVSDPNAVLYTGTAYWRTTSGSPAALPQHQDPSGAIFDLHDFSFRFRLLVPRTGAHFIQTAIDDIPSSVFPASLEPLKDNVFGALSSPPSESSDYPGNAFQLDLLFNLLTLHLGPHWLPAVQNSDFTISPDLGLGSPPKTDVRILLPQILLRYSQVQDYTQSPLFEVLAWGNPGFDAPNDLAEGQLATMDPTLAIHSSGRVAFGIDTIILDLSSNNTPPEILQYFGTDENFKGLYAKAIQVYYTDADKDLALNFAVRDALISFAGEVWLEAELDLIFDAFSVTVTAYDGSTSVPVNVGSQLSPSVWHGGALTLPSTGVIYLQIAGGIPPYTQSVTFTQTSSPPQGSAQQLWDNTQRRAQPPSGFDGTQASGSLVISVTDSTLPTPQQYTNTLKFTVTQSDASAGTPPAPPGPPANPKPKSVRRLSIRLRLEMNTVVMAEISGEVDFDAQMQSAVPGGSPPTSGNSLGITGTSAATARSSPPGGIVDFTLNVTYDLASGNLSETLTLGAVPADTNGLLHMDNTGDTALKDILGAILIFTPILSAAIKALDPSDAGRWTGIAIDLGVPVLIGSLKLVKTTGVTLYGGTLQLNENIHSGEFTNAALTFDYGVEFDIDIGALNIKSTKPLKVRYQAVGVSLHFGDPVNCQIVMDTSKGYSLDLSDPGLFNLPAPLGDLLKIAGARIARVNPVTIEVDIELKADLGIVTVDKFMVKVPLDGTSAPSITPSGVKVNIPETITGSGSVNISNGGFEGTLDLTLCDLGLRMLASVGVEHISQGARHATAFYLGFEIDFSTPITLGTTGLSLFGLFGLFGMHYDRVLSAPIPGDAVGPDLRWLMNTKGQPYLLESGGTHLLESGGTHFWQPKIDNWAFGVGVVLGTSDGYLLNMRGMFLLELPGPRIIITVNLKFVEDLPGLSTDGMDATELDVGIVGILDIDVGAGQITLGVMIDLEITGLISMQIPIQVFYSWNDPSTWHLWIGTIQTPASATILGIVRGGGYFMIGGQAIQPFPPGSSSALPGVAVAMGVSAAIMFGSESAGLYLKVAASANFGVSFAPTLFFVGDVHLEGALHLFVVDISATGDFALTAPNPVYIHVHVCGSVKFFFFKASACIDFSIGNASPAPLPPPLITNLYLQSFAPFIAQGQGDRPIDASLGNAVQGSGTPPVVPINAVPVIQMMYGVDVSAMTSTFTAPLPNCPTFPGSPGVNLGGGRFVQYRLKSLTISPALPGGFPRPPVAWRPNKPATNTSQTQVDLALFSRNPNVTNSALERSTQLTNTLLGTWGETCAAIAPAACVFWAFCGQVLGPSLNGWTLFGIPTPDPPNTTRRSPVPTQMQVTQPALSPAGSLLLSLGLPFAGGGLSAAKVIGSNAERGVAAEVCLRAVELPERVSQPFEPDQSAWLSANALDGQGFEGARLVSPAVTAATAAALLAAGNRWLRFETGESQRIRLLLAISVPHLGANAQVSTRFSEGLVSINERDATGNLVVAHPLPSLNPTVVAALTNLPSTWTATSGPWYRDVVAILSVLAGQTGMTTLFVEFIPAANTTTIEVAVTAPATQQPAAPAGGGAVVASSSLQAAPAVGGTAIAPSTLQAAASAFAGAMAAPSTQQPAAPAIGGTEANLSTWQPSVIVGAVESCPTSESVRYKNAAAIQQSTVQTLASYLDGGTPVPLLAPNTVYTIAVEYDTGSSTSPITQTYNFQTDGQPPAVLDPYVLCSSPDQGDQYVFYDDPVDVIFNDSSVFPLYQAYGYQLTMDLHAADGLPEGSPSGSILTGSPPALQPIKNGVGPATYDSMLQLVKQLPCVTGTILQYQNQKFTAPVQLRPLMGYTLDLIADLVVAVPAASSGSPPGSTAATPLFRRTFSTGRYANMQALAGALGGVPIRHRALKLPLNFPVSNPAQTGAASDIQQAFLSQRLQNPSWPAAVVMDSDIQQAFLAAGEQALPAPSANAIVMYWLLSQGNYVPHAILLDAIEPTWRVRSEPSFTTPIPSDPSFKIVTIAPVLSLGVTEPLGSPASSSIGSYIVSPGGARTVAMFKANFWPPASGTLVTLELHRPTSPVYGNPDETAVMLQLLVSAQAPWTYDHV
jgi:hypothetical protein